MDIVQQDIGAVGDYGLGLDIGESSVRAAIVRHRDGPTGPRPVPLSAGLLRDPGTRTARRALARVGIPTPLYLQGNPVAAAEPVARLVAAIVAEVAGREGGPPARTVLAVPPSWGEHRCAVLAGALAAAGVPAVSLISSALAAARHHRAAFAGDNATSGATVAVFDLGGGTLDTAVVRVDGAAVEHLAVPPPPLAWGGGDVDDALLAQLCGSLGLADAAGGEGPAEDGFAAEVGFAAEDGLAEELRSQCVVAKEALSADTAVVVDVRWRERTTSLRLVREDLQELVAGPIATSIDALRATVAGAGLAVEDLAAVLLTGGAVRMPMVAEAVSAALGRPVVAGTDPGATAVLGAAALAMDGCRSTLEVAPDSPDGGDAPGRGGTAIRPPGADGGTTGEDGGPGDGDPADVAVPPAGPRIPRRGARGGSRPAPGPRVGAAAAPRPHRTLHRSLVVAALFAALLLVPAGVLATLNGAELNDLGSRSVAAAGEPTTTAAPARGGAAPADATQGRSGGGRESATAARNHQAAGSPASPSQRRGTAGTGGATADALQAAGPGTPAGSTNTSPTGTSTAAGAAPAPPVTTITDPPTATTEPPPPTTDPPPTATTDPPVTTTTDPPPTTTTEPPPPTTDPPPTSPPADATLTGAPGATGDASASGAAGGDTP